MAGDWDRLPPKNQKSKPATDASAAPPDSSESIALGDVFSELSRLRAHRQAAEAEGRLGDVLALAKVELRALLRLARANGELDPSTQVRRAIHWYACVLISHTPEGSDLEGRLTVVVAEERIARPEPLGDDDDPIVEPGAGAAWTGLEALLRRAERLAGAVASDTKLTAQMLAFCGRVRDAIARVKGHPDAIVANPHYIRIRGRLLDCFEDRDETKRAANREILASAVRWLEGLEERAA